VKTIDRARLAQQLELEQRRFLDIHPKSRGLFQRAQKSLLAERFEQGVEEVIEDYDLPWIVKRLGCRAEYWFRPTPPRNGGEAAAAVDFELDQVMHLYALNRGILMTPFHNMALVSPYTSESDIDRHTAVFREAVRALAG
jgi:glutamate-1-semialdehyde 2,1-aminomutase